jgi:hypothetical protein
MVGPSSASINIQWRTNVACGSEVRYGTSAASLNSVVTDSVQLTDHTITLDNLSPNTKYFYSIGTPGTVLQSGADNFFYTAMPAGSIDTLRFWVTGDFGNNSTNQVNTMNAFLNYTASSPVHGWLWLGDNAYTYGTDAEYQTNVFNVYTSLLRRLPVYPALGNHDYGLTGYLSATSLGTTAPYFSIFSIPSNSGTEKYYSYNNGDVHFIVLDSYGSYNVSGSAMYNWLQNDLINNTRTWTVVYFHHPPYTKGSHNSDTETELIDMRSNIIPLLEQYGVDLVFGGHSHSYERSMLIKGHYGLESTFNTNLFPSGNVVQSSVNAYTKSSLRGDGTIYLVCGVSGQTAGTTSSGYPHNAMQVSTNANNGSVILEVLGGGLSCKFLTTAGSIYDQFTMTKTAAQPRLSDDPASSAAEYFDITGRYLGTDYFTLPLNELVIVRYREGGALKSRKIIRIP